MPSVKEQKADEPTYRFLVAAVAFVILLWAGSGVVLYDLQERGTFGDMFGAANALFSGLAFAALVYTINLQRTELRLQRLELSLTRAELEGQKLQLSAQNDLMRADSFEGSFFRVLTVLGDITNSIDIRRSDGNNVEGRDCFSLFYRYFTGRYNALKGHPTIVDEPSKIDYAFNEFYKSYQGDVGHYFRTLYNLFKLVDQSSIENKRFYTNLVRAQLSNQELLLLFYNCLSPFGNEKFKPLAERYALLKSIPIEQLVRREHLDLFHPSAFGEG